MTAPITSPFHELVGRYRLVVSDELLAFIERAFVVPAPEHDRAKVRAEAAAAELEIQHDGVLISRAGSQEFYRVQLPPPSPGTDLTFEKAPGRAVTLKLLPDAGLRALDDVMSHHVGAAAALVMAGVSSAALASCRNGGTSRPIIPRRGRLLIFVQPCPVRRRFSPCHPEPCSIRALPLYAGLHTHSNVGGGLECHLEPGDPFYDERDIQLTGFEFSARLGAGLVGFAGV